jgi:hypothetical protein
MVTAKSRAGYVVIVRGWGFVTASAVVPKRRADAMANKLRREGLKATVRRA